MKVDALPFLRLSVCLYKFDLELSFLSFPSEIGQSLNCTYCRLLRQSKVLYVCQTTLPYLIDDGQSRTMTGAGEMTTEAEAEE